MENYVDKGVYQDFLPYAEKNNIRVSAITENYNKCDVILNDKYTAEIKRRRGQYTSTHPLIQREGAMIEEAKYKYLNDTKNISGYTRGYYIMLFSDGIGYAFDITNIPYNELKWSEQRTYPRTTDFANTSKITKRSANIPLTKGKRFIFNEELYDQYGDNRRVSKEQGS